MNLKKYFLTLSIRHQISLVTELIAFFTLIIILILFYLYSNIILKIRSNSRETYFYDRYKLIFDSHIDFLNNLLHQYEQLIKNFNSQLYYYSISLDNFSESFFDNKEIPMIITNYNSSDDTSTGPPGPGESTQTTIKEYYQLNYDNEEGKCNALHPSKNYVFIHNFFNEISNLDILYLGIDGDHSRIFDDYLLVSLLCKYLFSGSKQMLKAFEGAANNEFDNYFESIKAIHYNTIKSFLEDYKIGEFSMIKELFPKKINLFDHYILLNDVDDIINDFLDDYSQYFTYINYSLGISFSYNDINQFIQEYKIMENYIANTFTRIQNFLNINSIPVFRENNTIFSKDLCFSFLFKQIILLNISTDYSINYDEIKKIYDNLKVGESDVSDCIFDEKYNINIENDLNSINQNSKFYKYYSLKNKRKGILFQLSQTDIGEKFFGIKYTFPDYTSIKNFQPEDLIIEQLNLYSFGSFREPTLFIKNMKNFYTKSRSNQTNK